MNQNNGTGFHKYNYLSGKELLSMIRSGDYAHAGEEEAIDLLIKNLPKKLLENRRSCKVLDVGCGLGGTAEMFRKAGFGEMFGVDLEMNAIQYAISKYPKVKFLNCDILKASNVFNFKFDLIYLFNVLYNIGTQEECLRVLNSISKKGTVLALFDYSNKTTGENVSEKSKKNRLYRGPNDWSPFIPLELNTIDQVLKSSGWKVIKKMDVSNDYQRWYTSFMKKMEDKKNLLISNYSEGVFEMVKFSYQTILDSITSNETGGIIIYCQKE